MIEFEIPGQPVGKGRPRLGKFGTYTPVKTVNYENWVKMCFIEKYRDFKPFEGRVKVKITAVFEPPKSISKKMRKNMIDMCISPTKKPDVDNITKGILDSLNTLAYRDDSQVVALLVFKEYGEQAKVIVEMEEF